MPRDLCGGFMIEVISAIALLCQVTAADVNYNAIKDRQIKCQQTLLKCVRQDLDSWKIAGSAEKALERCVSMGGY